MTNRNNFFQDNFVPLDHKRKSKSLAQEATNQDKIKKLLQQGGQALIKYSSAKSHYNYEVTFDLLDPTAELVKQIAVISAGSNANNDVIAKHFKSIKQAQSKGELKYFMGKPENKFFSIRSSLKAERTWLQICRQARWKLGGKKEASLQ